MYSHKVWRIRDRLFFLAVWGGCAMIGQSMINVKSGRRHTGLRGSLRRLSAALYPCREHL